MSKEPGWRWSYLVHPAVALGITAVIGLGVWWADLRWWAMLPITPVFFVFGYWREKIQHDWEPLTVHQWVEALNWMVGSIIATGVWIPWL